MSHNLDGSMDGSAGAAAAAAAIANAIKANGVLVQVAEEDFLEILNRQEEPLVVWSPRRMFSFSHRYLSSYKGLAFYLKSPHEITLPAHVETIQAGSIQIPGG